MFRGKLVAQWGVAAEFRLYGQGGRGGGREAGTWPGSQSVWSMCIKCPNTLRGESFFCCMGHYKTLHTFTNFV